MNYLNEMNRPTRNMLMLLLLVLLAFGRSVFAQPDCSAYMQGFNLWEDEVKGQIVLDHVEFPLRDWDPNQTYEGVVLTAQGKQLKKPSLEVEFKANKAGGKRKLETFRRVVPYSQNTEFNVFDDFKPLDFFVFKDAGNFTVRLKDDAKLICSQSFKYNLGD